MSVRLQKADTYFPRQSEMLYRYHSHIDQTLYPHMHDYYELTFVLDGSMRITINRQEHILKEGSFTLLRPNDIHEKQNSRTSCVHVNIAFLSNVFDEVFSFLHCPDLKDVFLSEPSIAPVHISLADKRTFDYDIRRLSMVPISDTRTVSRLLRTFLFKVLTTYFLEPYFARDKQEDFMPPWLKHYLRQLGSPEVLRAGTGFLYESSGLSKSHVCRVFTKHLRMSPTDYINQQRLIYASNLLSASDLDILTISQEAGFPSLSHFYHLFKEKYHVSPGKYRNQ